MEAGVIRRAVERDEDGGRFGRAERIAEADHEGTGGADAGRGGFRGSGDLAAVAETTYCVRYLQRVPLGTAYPAAVERVMKLVKNPRMMGPCEGVECYRRGRRGGGPAARGLARWTVGADDDYGRKCAGAVEHGLECAEAELGCRAASDV